MAAEGILSINRLTLGTISRLSCAHVARWRRQASGGGEPGEQRVLSSARAREAQARADAIELRNNIARGRYVSILAVRQRWETVAIALREAALGFSGKIADAVAKAQGRAEVFEIVDAEMRELLTC